MICRAQSQQGKAARVPFGYCAIGGIDGAMPSIIAPDPNGAIHELPLPPTAECSELRQLAQIAKQFARCGRRLFLFPLLHRRSDQLAQMLAIGLWIGL